MSTAHGRPTGYAIITDPYASTLQETDTYNCCHCQYLVHIHFGSGIERGYCFMCNAPTCGKPNCVECVPFMKKVEASENRARLHSVIERGCDSL